MIARISEITEISAAEDAGTLDPMIEVGVPELRVLPEGIGVDIGDVGDLGILQPRGRDGMQKEEPAVIGDIERPVDPAADVAVVEVGRTAPRRTDQREPLRRAFGTVDIVSLPRPRLAQIEIAVVIDDFGRIGAVRRLVRFGDGVPHVLPMDEVA